MQGDDRAFWDSLAPSYGKRRTPVGKYDRLKAVTEFLEAAGALRAEDSVLDIGCGPGVYALLFASRVREVVALDSAPKMCSVLREELSARGIRNVTVVNRAWEEVDLGAEGWKERFDLVFASLTPAIKDPETLTKMVAASRRYCCLVDFARGYRNPVLAELWPAVLGEPYPGGWFEISYPWNYLYASGYLPEIRFIADFWEEKMLLEEAVARYCRSLGRFMAVTPALEEKVRCHLLARSTGGVFCFRHRGYLAVLFWRVNDDAEEGGRRGI
ncbi:MAG: class I SAM-dependent methyltransferase [Bacillota bacterium]